MRILVINGPNLNLLFQRDAEKYGSLSLYNIEELLKKEFQSHSFQFFQSNSEGDIINQIHNSHSDFDGIIINPGGYAHTSVAIKDALELCKLPKIEVHLSNLASRENYRQNLITASSCDGYISGFKGNSYNAAVYLLEKVLIRK
ncbi:MAG: 3-dehydroquinate dehydratase [Ignavibacteria bacterium]|nr:3-dehydroquinate dehydratase [Ignavibacteria bacterium]MBT8381691.1 3-dehydroquinate dehydratase [Ignavibacteria bacterium]MBT8390312.1 3-dehydroquinate dehydratase [Ignavibacteria bacterium]NNJ53079.1 3-dehydroquinate dehydratase [Ignavibacteriaceae bacterium]NNL20283.1 3-dehydroquinate dehydratase [Ignavibacteriaceae bacterium]